MGISLEVHRWRVVAWVIVGLVVLLAMSVPLIVRYAVDRSWNRASTLATELTATGSWRIATSVEPCSTDVSTSYIQLTYTGAAVAVDRQEFAASLLARGWTMQRASDDPDDVYYRSTDRLDRVYLDDPNDGLTIQAADLCQSF